MKKSTAHPPACFRERLHRYAAETRRIAREVFVHRGCYKPRAPQNEIIRVWTPRASNGRRGYTIDRKHPLVQSVDEMLPAPDQKKTFKALLRILEETLPAGQIWLDTAEGVEVHSRPFETAAEIEKRRTAKLMYDILREKRGLSHESAKAALKAMEGFEELEPQIEMLTE